MIGGEENFIGCCPHPGTIAEKIGFIIIYVLTLISVIILLVKVYTKADSISIFEQVYAYVEGMLSVLFIYIYSRSIYKSQNKLRHEKLDDKFGIRPGQITETVDIEPQKRFPEYDVIEYNEENTNLKHNDFNPRNYQDKTLKEQKAGIDFLKKHNISKIIQCHCDNNLNLCFIMNLNENTCNYIELLCNHYNEFTERDINSFGVKIGDQEYVSKKLNMGEIKLQLSRYNGELPIILTLYVLPRQLTNGFTKYYPTYAMPEYKN